jgi:tetratricopeptide (TPR) repeat protein
VAALLFAALAWAAADRGARRRLKAALPWTSWGIAWFLAFGAGLTVIYPIWAPYRVVFGALGLGIAATAILGAIHPALLMASLAVRTIAFAASPGPPTAIAAEAPSTGAFLDYGRLVRLQRLMRETRQALHARFPTLPPGSRVGQHSFPRSATYALGGDRALQVWYRDTTVHWLRYEDYEEKPPPQLATIAEFQPHRTPQIVVVEPEAMRALHDAIQSMRRADCVGTIAELDRADSLQRDRNAAVFLASVGAKRALCLMQLGRVEDAEREARRAGQLWPDNFDSGYVLANVALARGRLDEAERLLVEVLAHRPQDQGAMDLLGRVRAQRRAPTGR